MGKIILASQSPRRRQLLEQMGITDFVICPAQGEEDMGAHLPPDRLSEALALAKAREVAAQARPEDLIIAADTIEEKIIALHQTKKNMADALLEGGDVSASMSREEMIELLKEL